MRKIRLNIGAMTALATILLVDPIYESRKQVIFVTMLIANASLRGYHRSKIREMSNDVPPAHCSSRSNRRRRTPRLDRLATSGIQPCDRVRQASLVIRAVYHQISPLVHNVSYISTKLATTTIELSKF